VQAVGKREQEAAGDGEETEQAADRASALA
jgi:hypothetical protein